MQVQLRSQLTVSKYANLGGWTSTVDESLCRLGVPQMSGGGLIQGAGHVSRGLSQNARLGRMERQRQQALRMSGTVPLGSYIRVQKQQQMKRQALAPWRGPDRRKQVETLVVD